MDRGEIKTKLIGVLQEVFDDDNLVIEDTTTANDVEAWDSFNHVRMIVSVEEEFGVSFSAAAVAELQNVGELIDVIEKSLAA